MEFVGKLVEISFKHCTFIFCLACTRSAYVFVLGKKVRQSLFGRWKKNELVFIGLVLLLLLLSKCQATHKWRVLNVLLFVSSLCSSDCSEQPEPETVAF